MRTWHSRTTNNVSRRAPRPGRTQTLAPLPPRWARLPCWCPFSSWYARTHCSLLCLTRPQALALHMCGCGSLFVRVLQPALSLFARLLWRHSASPEGPHSALLAAVRLVTRDQEELVLILHRFLSTQPDTVQAALLSTLQAEASSRRVAVETALDWVIAVYKQFLPFLLLYMLCASLPGGGTDRAAPPQETEPAVAAAAAQRHAQAPQRARGSASPRRRLAPAERGEAEGTAVVSGGAATPQRRSRRVMAGVEVE